MRRRKAKMGRRKTGRRHGGDAKDGEDRRGRRMVLGGRTLERACHRRAPERALGSDGRGRGGSAEDGRSR